MEDSKGAIIVIALLGVLGLLFLSSKRNGYHGYMADGGFHSTSPQPITDMYNRWERIDGPTVVPTNIQSGIEPVYQNEKRIKIIRGEDGHIEELIIHHTIKKNSMSKIPEGVFEI